MSSSGSLITDGSITGSTCSIGLSSGTRSTISRKRSRKNTLSEQSEKSTLDKIVSIVERTEETTQSQSSKLEFLETTLRETKEKVNEKLLALHSISAGSGEGDTVDRAAIDGILRAEIRRIEEKIEQVKSISCSLIEEVSESNKNAFDNLFSGVFEGIDLVVQPIQEDFAQGFGDDGGQGPISFEFKKISDKKINEIN